MEEDQPLIRTPDSTVPSSELGVCNFQDRAADGGGTSPLEKDVTF